MAARLLPQQYKLQDKDQVGVASYPVDEPCSNRLRISSGDEQASCRTDWGQFPCKDLVRKAGALRAQTSRRNSATSTCPKGRPDPPFSGPVSGTSKRNDRLRRKQSPSDDASDRRKYNRKERIVAPY